MRSGRVMWLRKPFVLCNQTDRGISRLRLRESQNVFDVPPLMSRSTFAFFRGGSKEGRHRSAEIPPKRKQIKYTLRLAGVPQPADGVFRHFCTNKSDQKSLLKTYIDPLPQLFKKSLATLKNVSVGCVKPLGIPWVGNVSAMRGVIHEL